MKPMDVAWKESLERLAAANHRARVERLRALTLEQAYEIFEDLCESFPGPDPAAFPRTHPIGLCKIWNVR